MPTSGIGRRQVGPCVDFGCSPLSAGTPGETAFGFLLLEPDFLPPASGDVALIDPNQVVLSLTGTILGSGERALAFAIPAEPDLVGVELFSQGGLVSNGTVETSTPYSDTISF